MNADHRPAHSCKHCQRIVLPHKIFVGTNHTLKLPHTGPEVRSAIDDGCDLFLPLFGSGFFSDSVPPRLHEFVEYSIAWAPGFRTVCWKISKYRALRKARKWGGSFYIDVTGMERATSCLLPGCFLSIRYEQWKQIGLPKSLKVSLGK
jgi:hypothetical protein